MRIQANVMALAMVLLCVDAFAGAYKCSDSNGKVSYQQQPCPVGSTQTSVQASAGSAGERWVLVKASTWPNGSKEAYYLDRSSFKSIGRFKRVAISQTAGEMPPAYSRVTYAYYDCGASKVSDAYETFVHDMNRAELLGEDVIAQYNYTDFAEAQKQGAYYAQGAAISAVCGK